MAKAMELLQKLGINRSKEDIQTAFDLRLEKLSRVRQVAVARAVLFRTGPSRSEA